VTGTSAANDIAEADIHEYPNGESPTASERNVQVSIIVGAEALNMVQVGAPLIGKETNDYGRSASSAWMFCTGITRREYTDSLLSAGSSQTYCENVGTVMVATNSPAV
jgi:hypothetical protein